MQDGLESDLNSPHRLLVLCVAFIFGTGYCLLSYNIYVLLLFILLAGILYIKNLISTKFLLILLSVFLLAISYTNFRMPKTDSLYKEAPIKTELIGKVITEPRPDLNSRTKFYFQTDKGKTLVTIYDYKRKFEKIKTGDELKLYGKVKPPYKATNWGQFDYAAYLRNKGVFTLTQVGYKDWEVLLPASEKGFSLTGELIELKNKIIQIHAKTLKSPNLEVLGGMVFGDNAVPAPDDVEQDFLKAGLLHLLAASGMNVGIIFGIWYFLTIKIGMPYRKVIIGGMILVALYSLMTGLPPSVTRAALMTELLLIAKLFDRQADNIAILALACALMLLYNPYMLSEVGFQLSFAVTFGLLLFSRFFTAKNSIIYVPVVAQLFAAPLQIFHFNNLAIYSVFANILATPFVGIISIAGFIGSICAMIPVIGEKICFISDKIAQPFVILILYISKTAASLPDSLQYLLKPSLIVMFTFYAVLILFAVARKHTITAAIILVYFSFQAIPNKSLEIMFFDVGEGDSILITTPDNKHILVDTGSQGWINPAKSTIIPYLRDKGINSIDLMVLTHPDSDHIGGAADILKAIKVKKLYHNGEEKDTYTYKALIREIALKQTDTSILESDDIVLSGKGYVLKAIRPVNTDSEDSNEDAIMTYIEYKNFSSIFMADCESGSLNDIVKIVKKPINVLKVGHHGSIDSVNQELMDYLKPEIAVISVGEKGYQWGHPDNQTLSLLNKGKTTVLRTDKDYAIRLNTDGSRVKYTTFKSTIKF